MDDSDEDFVDLCSRFLKRVHKKGTSREESGDERKQPLSQVKEGTKQRPLKHNADFGSRRELAGLTAIQPKIPHPTPGLGSGGEKMCEETTMTHAAAVTTAAPQVSSSQPAITNAEPLGVKEKMVLKMQKFKRLSPQRLKLNTESSPHPEETCQLQDMLEPALSPQGDEALALRLQQELNSEACVGPVDLELGGLFFCQICQKDLSAMNPLRRAQHVNRCLDECERSARPLPAPPQAFECPICGKCFKSQKSQLAHVKRCAMKMGVAPTTLMDTLQRQAVEGMNSGPRVQRQKSKRTGSENADRPARKKPKNKIVSLDEDTLMAMALSRSMLEQEQENQKEKEMEMQFADTHGGPGMNLQWRTDAGKRHGKKKGYPTAPPPLLLIQDPQEALRRLQDRAAALLLHTQSCAPPTPGLPASSLPAWTGAAPLWQRSMLRDGGSSSILDFYTAELSPPIEPWAPPTMQRKPAVVPSSRTLSGPASEPIIRPGDSPCLVKKSAHPTLDPAPSLSTSVPTVSSQTMCDLMDLAEEGMTLTQCGHVLEPVSEKGSVGDLPHSGYIPTTEEKSWGNVSRLADDLGCMVNNPQLSDVQLQVDSGEVFFAHFFMLYARCPLLVQLVHDSGFGVKEDGMPQAQRVLLGDTPAEAALALLQYIYTGRCLLKPALVPHVQELAVRLDMGELEELCLQCVEGVVVEPWSELRQPQDNKEEDIAFPSEQSFLELLRSMWDDEENEEGGGGTASDVQGCQEVCKERTGSPMLEGDGELGDERVDEDELDEIYEFAATQRKLESGGDAGEDNGEQDADDDVNSNNDDDDEAAVKEEVLKHEGWEKGDYLSQQKQLLQGVGECEEFSTEVDEVAVIADTRTKQPKEPAVPVTDLFMKGGMGSIHNGLEGTVKPDKVLNADTSLDKSLDHLFSQSWGEFVESPSTQDCSHSPSLGKVTAGQPEMERESMVRTPLQRANSQHLSCHSQEAIIDLSVSPPLCTSISTLPVTGPSTACVMDKEETDINTGSLFCNGRPQVCHGNKAVVHEEQSTVVKDSNLPGKKTCSGQMGHSASPELIVLSDSADEMDIDLKNEETKSCTDLNQLYPQIPQDHLSNAGNVNCGIEPEEALPVLSEKLAQLNGKEEASQDFPQNVSSSCSSLVGSSPMEQSTVNSWLVPGTPVQSSKVTRSGSTQTHISMCRTQLFPKSTTSSTSVRIHKASATACPAHTCQHMTQVSLCTVDSITEKQTACSFCSSDLRMASLSGSGQGDVLRKRMDTVDANWEERHRQSERKSELSRQINQCGDHVPSDTGWTSVPPAASSTPLATNAKEHLNTSRRSISLSYCEQNICSSQHSASRKEELTGKSSVMNPQVDGPRSLHLSLKDTSLSPCRDADTGSSLSKGSGRCRNSEELDHSKSVNNNEREGCLGENPDYSSLPVQSFFGMDEPPMPHEDLCSPGVYFSLRMDSSKGVSPPEQGQNKDRAEAFSPSPSIACDKTPQTATKQHASMLDSMLWDNWGEDDDDDAGQDVPLSQRVCSVVPAQRVTQLKTPVVTSKRGQPPLEPVTPMPPFSDMDTPELKNRLNRFGVRPLPKRQMVLKLKEIHQYTHQLQSSESEEEAASSLQDPSSAHLEPHHPLSKAQHRSGSTLTTAGFKEPVGAVLKTCSKAAPPQKQVEDEEGPLSVSQGSTVSSAASSEDTERSNPELCSMSEDDSDSDGVMSSQALSRDAEKLQAVRNLIQSDPDLYRQILQYQPLVLSQLQAQLKAAGIRLGARKLLDFLDTQCITVTTANPNKSGSPRQRGRRRGRVSRRRGAAQTSE